MDISHHNAYRATSILGIYMSVMKHNKQLFQWSVSLIYLIWTTISPYHLPPHHSTMVFSDTPQ